MTTVHSLPERPEEVPERLRDLFEVERIEAPGGRVAFTKGALDELISRCDAVAIDHDVEPLDDELRRRALGAGERLAA